VAKKRKRKILPPKTKSSKAKKIKKAIESLPVVTCKITQVKAEKGLTKQAAGSVDLVATDPPWGIEWPGYGEFKDDVVGDEYVKWCESWIKEVHRVLKPDGSFWLAIGPEYVSELDVAAKKLGFHKRAQITQYSTFGVANTKNFARTSSFWLYFTKHKKKFTFNAAEPLLRVPSARQLKYKDKRANKDGKLPDSVWVLHPDYMATFYGGQEDVWLASRVAGTFKERQFRGQYNENKTCPQMPLAVMDRIILASSKPGDTVLDAFTGTGSTAESAIKLGRNFIGFELVKSRAVSSRKRVKPYLA